MMGGRDGALQIAMSRLGPALLVTVPNDLGIDGFQALRVGILRAVEASHIHAVVLDMTAVDLIDDADVRALLSIVRACSLMGAGVRVAGLRPSLCALMADLPDVDRLEAYLGVQEALASIQGDSDA